MSAFNNADLRLLSTFSKTFTLALSKTGPQAGTQQSTDKDALSGLYTSRHFMELAKGECERAKRYKRHLTILLLDIDNFGRINDFYGYDIGDNVIDTTAQIIKKNLREIDLIGRYGADEFILLLPETDLFGAATVAERLHQVITQEPVKIKNVHMEIRLTISVGLSKLMENFQNVGSLIKLAEQALEAAKQTGGARTEIR